MSKPGKLAKYDWKKIGTGAILAGSAAGIAYLIQAFQNGNSIYAPLMVAGLSVLLNVVRKLSSDTTPGE